MKKIDDIEDLHPKLRQRFDDHELDHRLVPYGYDFDQAKEVYEYKYAKVQKALSERNWESCIGLYERPYRLEVLLELIRSHELRPEESGPLVGLVWCGTERAWDDREEWRRLWLSYRPHRHLVMTEEERAHLDGLSSELTVWRGTNHRQSVRGFSWTLDRKVAFRFAHRLPEATDPLFMVRGRIRKADVIAYLNGRNEEEIVAAPESAYCIRVKQLRNIVVGH